MSPSSSVVQHKALKLLMLIELHSLYNFASVTFDLEGQTQGQKRKRLIFVGETPKSRLVSRKILLLLQFSTEAINIVAYGSPLVGVYGVSTDFCSDAPW